MAGKVLFWLLLVVVLGGLAYFIAIGLLNR